MHTLALLLACSGGSETGTPGPLGPAWESAAYYQHLRPDQDLLSPEHAELLDAILADAPYPSEGRASRERGVRVVDDGAWIADLTARWQTWEVGGRQLVLAASLEATAYADGWSCASAPPRTREAREAPLAQIVDLDVTCEWVGRNKSSMVGLALSFGGDGGDGALRVLAGEAELQ